MTSQVWVDELTETPCTGDDDICHIVECHDDNRTLCGLDVKTVGWCIPGHDPSCVVCLDLEPRPCGCNCGCCGEGLIP